MNLINRLRHSINFKMFILLVTAGLFCIGVDYGLNWACDYFISEKLDAHTYQKKMNQRSARKLQEYVFDNDVNTTSRKKLKEWSKREETLDFWVVTDGETVYTSSGTDYIAEDMDLEDPTAYPIEFHDRKAVVYMDGAYLYNLYIVMTTEILIFSFVLFIVIILIPVNRKMRYLIHIRRGVEIMEGGDLDYRIEVRGNDEIAGVASSINDMSATIADQIAEQKRMHDAGNALITSMSHDLRSPLTSILLYTQLLLAGKFNSEEQRMMYLSRIEAKAKQLKQMSDNLFEYVLVGVGEDVHLTKSSFRDVFYDRLSEMCGYLGNEGCEVSTSIDWGEGDDTVYICPDYIPRILDNLTSNLDKYADKSGEVHLTVRPENGGYLIAMQNLIRTEWVPGDSNHVGLVNVRKMMEAMHGVSDVAVAGDRFAVQLHFRKA